MEDGYDWNEEDWNDIEDDTEGSADGYEDHYNSDEDTCNREDNPYDPAPYGGLRPDLWVQVKIDNQTLLVSSKGRYRYHNSLEPSTDGIVLHGTPFRYTVIAGKSYFMHDLVWQAFYGNPTEGWEVRHKQEYTTLRRRKVYSNNLANIGLYPKVVRLRALTFE